MATVVMRAHNPDAGTCTGLPLSFPPRRLDAAPSAPVTTPTASPASRAAARRGSVLGDCTPTGAGHLPRARYHRPGVSQSAPGYAYPTDSPGRAQDGCLGAEPPARDVRRSAHDLSPAASVGGVAPSVAGHVIISLFAHVSSRKMTPKRAVSPGRAHCRRPGGLPLPPGFFCQSPGTARLLICLVHKKA